MEVKLCKNYINELDRYYPYLTPREELIIIEVSQEQCDNTFND